MSKDEKLEVGLAVIEGKFAMSDKTKRKVKEAVKEGIGRLARKKLNTDEKIAVEIPNADLEKELYKGFPNPIKEWVRNYWAQHGEQLPYCDQARQITEDLIFFKPEGNGQMTPCYSHKDTFWINKLKYNIVCSYTNGDELHCALEVPTTVKVIEDQATLECRCKNIGRVIKANL